MSKAIRRLGCERVEDAIECLQDCPRGEGIHCARKDIKKIRAVLRLVRTRIQRKDFRLLRKSLKSAGKRLAGPRDAYIVIKTLRRLTSHFKRELARNAFRHIRAELRDAFRAEMKRFAEEKTVKMVKSDLQRVAKGMERVEIKSKGWRTISPGLKSSYAAGRRAYRTALKEPAPENLHEWRKGVKDLWYHISLLRRVWPEQIDAISSELGLLEEYLGDHHDLVMLQQKLLDEGLGQGHPRETETLTGLIEQRQKELRDASIAIGARFYAEKPSAFCERLAGYWAIWCREKKNSRQFAEAAGN